MKELLMKVKEESEKVDLKLNTQKTKIMASGPIKVKFESELVLSCSTLRSPMDCSPPGSSIHVILQARILEWVTILPPSETVLSGKLKNVFPCFLQAVVTHN